MKYIGKVKKKVARGSKSGRESLFLETDSGEFILRRKGSVMFVDLAFEYLQNKIVEYDGVVHGNVLSFDSFKVIS